MERPCGGGPWSPGGTEGKPVCLESPCKRETGLRKGLREAGTRSCRLWSVSCEQWEHMKGFKPGKGRGQLWAAPGLPQRASSSHKIEHGELSFTTHRPHLQEDAENPLTSPGLKLREKQVLSKENNPNERDREGETGWTKNVSGKENTLYSTLSLPPAPRRALYKHTYNDVT